MSAMRHTNNQVNCKSSVKSASSHQSVQRQVIGQINVKSTSENHSRPKNRKSGKRLTPIASDRPAPPVLRRWRGGATGRGTPRRGQQERSQQHSPLNVVDSSCNQPSGNTTTACMPLPLSPEEITTSLVPTCESVFDIAGFNPRQFHSQAERIALKDARRSDLKRATTPQPTPWAKRSAGQNASCVGGTARMLRSSVLLPLLPQSWPRRSFGCDGIETTLVPIVLQYVDDGCATWFHRREGFQIDAQKADPYTTRNECVRQNQFSFGSCRLLSCFKD